MIHQDPVLGHHNIQHHNMVPGNNLNGLLLTPLMSFIFNYKRLLCLYIIIVTRMLFETLEGQVFKVVKTKHVDGLV